MNLKIVTAFSLVVLLFLSFPACSGDDEAIDGGGGDVEITNVAGSIQDEATVTISGAGFGTKLHGSPLRWVDFDEGPLNELLDEPGWGVSYDSDTWCKPNYHFSEEISRDGTQSGMFCGERSSDGYEYQQFYTGHLNPPENKLYFSGYIWFDWGEAHGEVSQIKTWRIHSGDASAFASTPWAGSENTRYEDGRTGCRVTNREDNCPELGDGDMRMYHTCYQDKGWSYFQVILDRGDFDSYNGLMKQYINGVDQGGPFEDYQFLCSGDGPMDNIIIGNYFGNTTTQGWENQVHFDDVYVDDTWQRVEVGDAPVYNDCTHREIQIPITWTSESIEVTVNQGTFLTGETAYVFVVNQNNHPSAGYPISF